MHKVLLCPPTYYDIEYEINPWMDSSKKVDQAKVHKAYQKLKSVYEMLGVTIEEIKQERGLPDMVYAANYGFVKDNVFIKANFTFDERKGEAEFAKKYFEKHKFVIKELPTNIAWEGQGDFLKVGKKYFLGWGKRSDKKAKTYLEELLDAEIIALKLIDPYYYHLDTCFLPLNEQTVAINPASFDQAGLETIAKHFPNIIQVSKQDNSILACNAVVIDTTIVIGKGLSEALKKEFARFGFKTQEVPMEEYRKGGGSVKCLTLTFA